MSEYLGERMVLRSGVLDRLLRAQGELSQRRPQTRIRLVYGYRHPEVQRRYFEQMSLRISEENVELSEEEIRIQAHQFVAIPEVAGHPTGGAVDVTLSENGCDLDMGSQILSFDEPELVPALSAKVGHEAKQNRLLLREVMIGAGFAPFNGEWWHFSYGDREWAAFYENPQAIYAPVLLHSDLSSASGVSAELS